MRKSNIQTRWPLSALAIAIQLGFGSAAWGEGALPQGASVVNGQVVITKPSDTSMHIKASGGSIVNWQQFSVGAGNQVRIALPSSSSAILNRVVGSNASQLLGSLQSNGRVFLINPNGIVVGSGARIDANSFIASTLNLSDADFLAGKLRFLAPTGAGTIRNDGVITAGPGGRIALIAPDIQNTGIIQAPDGKILLAAGRSLEIASLDFEGVTFEIQAPTDAVLNLGQLLADNGAVSAFAGSLRNSGEIRARRMVQGADGSIVLSGSNEVALSQGSQTVADGLSGGGIRIESLGTTRVAGSVSATGNAGVMGGGGSIQILGDRVAMEAGARVDASGTTGGGTLLVGGDFQGKNPDIQNASRVFVDADATLKADALQNGNGGKVVVWADENTRYFGSLSARGGALGGNGGNAEVSGKQNLQFAGSADLSAPAGQSGNLLLDPLDILVSSTGGVLSTVVDQFSDFSGNVVTISPTAMNNVQGTVTLQADRDIYFNSAVALTTAGAGLTATAGGTTFDSVNGGQIYLNQAISTNGGAVTLRSVGITGSAAISTAGGAVDIKTSGSENYSGAITTAGGAVRLEAGAGSVSSANVNAGTGAVTLTTSTGSISSNTLTGGTITLVATGGSVSNVYVDAATQIDASATNGSISLINYNSQPLRLGTVTTPNTVTLRSNNGMTQVAGGSVTGSSITLYNDSTTTGMGSAATPLRIGSTFVYANGYNSNGLQAAAHIQFINNPTLQSLYLEGSRAALSASTVMGAANLSSLGLGVSNGALSITADSGAVSGFGSSYGFNITVTDAGITAPTLNLLGGNVTLNSAADLTIGTLNAASLYATANGAVSLTTINTTGSGGIYVTTNACTTSYVGCTAQSPITAATLNAGNTGDVRLYTYDNGDITVSGSLTARSATLSAGDLYYTAAYPYYPSMRTTNNISLASASTTSSFRVDHEGIGDVTLSSLAAGGSVNVNAGGTYAQSISTSPYVETVTTTNQITINLAEPTTPTGSFNVSNNGVGNVNITGAVARPNGSVDVYADNGNVTLTGDVSASSSVSISAGNGALDLADVTSTNNSVTLTAGTTLTVDRVSAGALTDFRTNAATLSAGGDLLFESVTSQAYSAYGGSYGSVSLTSSGGSIETSADNTTADITASGNVTITANDATNGAIGNSSFVNPLDIVSGTGTSTANTVSLSAGKDIGAVGKAINVDTVGTLSATSTGGNFFVAAKALDSTTQRSLTGIRLSASAAGIGATGTSTLTSLDLDVNASSDGSEITIGDVVRTSGALNEFSFSATGTSGLSFGNVNLATTGYNQLFLTSTGDMAQTDPLGSTNLTAGHIELKSGSGTMTVGNITSADVVGNEVNLSGGAISAGDISGRSVKVASTGGVAVGQVTSLGDTKSSPYQTLVPRKGTYQVVTDELRITATGSLATGNISSATSVYLTGDGVTVGGGTGTVTGGRNDNFYSPDRVNLQSGAARLEVGDVVGYDVSLTGNEINAGNVEANRTLTVGDASTDFLTTDNLTNFGTVVYGTAGISIRAGDISTGDVSTSQSLTITAGSTGNTAQTYAPVGNVLLSAANTTITAANGIDLTGATLTSPTVTLNTTSGDIIAPLTGTTNLTISTGGVFNASSTAAIGTLYVTANGGVAGAGAGSAVSDVSGEIFKVMETGANALELTYTASTGATRSTYTDSNVGITDINLTTASTLLSGSSITVNADSATADVTTASGLTIAGGSLNISTGGNITLTSVSTGSGSVTATSNAGAIALNGVTTTTGTVNATAAGGDVTLTSVTTGGGTVTARATGSTGNVGVTSINSTGGNVTLTSANGSIVANGAGLHIDSRGVTGGASGTTTLTAANGSIGTGAAQLKTSGAVTLNVDAKNEINVDVANTALTSLGVTTRASGTGAVAVTNSNYAGLAITRANGTDLNLSAISPTAASAFSLVARDGNINVLGNITNVTNLTLDAGYGQSAGGNLNIAGPSGGARSITTTGTLSLKAGGDVVLLAGAASTDNISVQGGTSTSIAAGGDIQFTADGGSVLLSQSPQNFAYGQSLTAGGDIVLRGGQGTASAQVLSLGAQSIYADGDLKILGGTVGSTGGFARMQSDAGTQTVSINNLLLQGGVGGAYAALQGVTQSAQQVRGSASLIGGTGSGAFAEMKSTGTSSQNLGNQEGYTITNFTDGVLVQGGTGAGAYASLTSAGSQNIRSLGNIQVLAGSGTDANADITAVNSQTLGAVGNYTTYYGYTYRPTDSVRVEANAAAMARILAGSTQTVLAGTGGITVLGGTGDGLSASIETTGGSQTIGSSDSGSYVPTAFITVQGGSGGPAWIKATSGQTIRTGGDLNVLGGSGANATASIETTGGNQSIGNTYQYSNDALDTIRVSGGTGNAASAWIKATSGQTIDAGVDILVTGGGTGAYADISTSGGSQNIGNQNGGGYDQTNTLVLTGGSGTGAFARMAALGGAQTLRAANGITLVGGTASGAGATALGTTGQNVNTAGALTLQGGSGDTAKSNETGLRNTASGNQTVTASTGIAMTGGAAGSNTWIKQAGNGVQTVTTYGNMLLTAPVAGADAVSVEAGPGGQTFNVSGLLSLNNAGANEMQLDTTGNQTFNAAAMEILNSSTTGTLPKASVRATGNQALTLNGNGSQAASLKVANTSATSGSRAQMEAGGTQVVAMNYLNAGLMQVGSTDGQGIARVYSTGDQTLVVGELLVQGGATAAATANLSAGSLTSSTMLISTLGGPMQVLGGVAGSATIDPLNLDVVSNGSIQITGGTTSTAGSNVTAGAINMTATNGNMAVIGGGSTATVTSSTTFNLTNSGGLTFSGNGTVNASGGGSVLLGAPCTGCSSGLVGPFSVSAPAASAGSVTAGADSGLSYFFNLSVGDWTTWDMASLDLASAGYELVVAEDGTITTRRRSLVQCY